MSYLIYAVEFTQSNLSICIYAIDQWAIGFALKNYGFVSLHSYVFIFKLSVVEFIYFTTSSLILI